MNNPIDLGMPGWLIARREEDAEFGMPDHYWTSRRADDYSESNLLRDVAFNRHSMNDGHHVSPTDNNMIQVGDDGIRVRLVQPINEAAFQRTLSKAQRATIGIDLTGVEDSSTDWQEMLRGGLQTALETQVVVFEVSGLSRTCTHQLVRSRRAAFHQQSQRASFYGDRPEVRMPESVWRNDRAREAFKAAYHAAAEAYRVATEEDISYQDARYALPEGTTNYIMCEYPVREFLAVYAYRACSMFSWEIVSVVREMGKLLVNAHPWLEPFVKISCQTPQPCKACDGSGRSMVVAGVPTDCAACGGLGKQGNKCTFQGWESVEGQCPLPWAKEDNRVFRSEHHRIERKP